MTRFTYRGARSLSTVIALISVTLIEGVAFTFLLSTRAPLVALALLVLNVWGIVWFLRDYHALGTGAVEVDDAEVRMQVGLRWHVTVPQREVAQALRPTFRDLPTPGTTDAQDYINLTKPAAPNVLLILETPTHARGRGGIKKTVRRCGLKLDQPDEFLAALSRGRGQAS